jgi:hypothetical protein
VVDAIYDNGLSGDIIAKELRRYNIKKQRVNREN